MSHASPACWKGASELVHLHSRPPHPTLSWSKADESLDDTIENKHQSGRAARSSEEHKDLLLSSKSSSCCNCARCTNKSTKIRSNTVEELTRANTKRNSTKRINCWWRTWWNFLSCSPGVYLLRSFHFPFCWLLLLLCSGWASKSGTVVAWQPAPARARLLPRRLHLFPISYCFNSRSLPSPPSI